MTNKVLLIDDEITSNTKIGEKIRQFLSEANFELIFSQTWLDDGFGPKAEEIFKTDSAIRLVLLDILFPGQRLEGGAIFEEIKKINIEMPVVILTKKDVYTEAEEFIERGVKDYIVKKAFEKRSSRLLNYLKSLSQNPQNEDLALLLTRKRDTLVYMDIHDEKGYSVLKQRRMLSGPLLTLIRRCIDDPEHIASFPDAGKKGSVKDLEPWDRITIQKEVWKFNRSIQDSSRGRVHSLLKGMGIHGASAFKLVIGNVKIKES